MGANFEFYAIRLIERTIKSRTCIKEFQSFTNALYVIEFLARNILVKFTYFLKEHVWKIKIP